MADDKIELIDKGQPIRASWLNRIVSQTNAIQAPKQLPFGDQGSGNSDSVGVTTYWTVTATTTEEIVVDSDDLSCSVTVTHVTGFTATDGAGNTMIVSGF